MMAWRTAAILFLLLILELSSRFRIHSFVIHSITKSNRYNYLHEEVPPRKMTLEHDDGTPATTTSTTNTNDNNDFSLSFLLQDEQFRRACHDVATALVERGCGGVATLQLPLSTQHIPRRAFSMFRAVLREHDNQIENTPTTKLLEPISATADSAHVTGYHDWGGLSRYNQYRRGFVFSDGNQSLPFSEDSQYPEFQDAVHQLYDLLHLIFDGVLQALEECLELPPQWFQQQLGPTYSNSQWHLKEYASSACHDVEEQNNRQNKHLLGTHTDPSLLSVVIHDRPGVQRDGYGLQYAIRNSNISHDTTTTNNHSKQQSKTSTTWKDVECTGHGVAVIFIGSVMATLTQGNLPACTHRVVETQSCTNTTTTAGKPEASPTRVAATLFGRPAPDAVLAMPPSPQWKNSRRSSTANTAKPPLLFSAWNARVARNYEKSKHRKGSRQHTPSR